MRKKNEITEYVAAALIFVCAVAVSLGIFLVCTQNSIERNSQKVIKTNVSRQSEHIKAILDIHYGYLRGIAKEIGKSEELVSDENMEMLISLEEETALERTALIEADGTAHYDNGAEKNVSLRRYFKEGMEGKETLSDPLRWAAIWYLWAILWGTAFVEDICGKKLGKFVPYLQVFEGIVTAWVPGVMMLLQIW